MQKKLTLIEASCIITGYGVGGGILAVPYLASLNGAAMVIVIMLAAYLFPCSCTSRSPSSAWAKRKRQVVEFSANISSRDVSRNVVWLFFTLLVLVFLVSQAPISSGRGNTG